MSEINTCTICQEPLARYGCRAPLEIGAFCQAPMRQPTTTRVTFRIRPGMEIVKCSRCPANIVWIKTESGKRMPVENDEPHRGESHFAHCPYAAEFRKPKARAR